MRNFISGGRYNETLTGGANEDVFYGSPGNDTLDGGGGIDTVDYRTLLDNAWPGYTLMSGIEANLANDFLNGDEGDDVVAGGADNDTQWGGHHHG
jgi:Ca2+-binding RTX toxin-like protein